MRWKGWGSVGAALVGFLTSGPIFAAFLWGRHLVADVLARGQGMGPLPPHGPDWWASEGGPAVVVAGLTGALAAVLATLWASWRKKRLLARLGERISLARKSPSAHVLDPLRHDDLGTI